MERNQAEEIARSADRITEAVRELSYSVDRLGEHEATQGTIFREVLEDAFQRALAARPNRPNAGLPEEAAAAVADEAVRRVRRELASGRAENLKPPPSPEEVEDWEARRQERKEREVYH